MQTKFNANTNVILRACSEVTMISHQWTPKSAPAIQGAEIIPRSAVEKKQLQPTATVVLLEPMVLSAKLDEPYTFVLRATFVSPPGDTTADARSNTHELTLQLNYVRTLVGSRFGVLYSVLISCLHFSIACVTATPRQFAGS